MNKKELIIQISEVNDISKKQAGEEVERVLGGIASALVNGEDLKLAGFGNFEQRTRAARKGRNPQNGEEIMIPESHNIGFKAAKAIKDELK